MIFFSIVKNVAYRKDVSVRIWKLTFFFFFKGNYRLCSTTQLPQGVITSNVTAWLKTYYLIQIIPVSGHLEITKNTKEKKVKCITTTKRWLLQFIPYLYIIQRDVSFFSGFVLQNKGHSGHAHFVIQVFFFEKYWEHMRSWLHSVL